MTIDDYAEIDFSLNSKAAADLFSRMAEEVKFSTVTLTPIFFQNGIPAFLTRAMENWYKYYVQPVRSRAVDEVAKIFEAKANKRKGMGFLFERERDTAELRSLEAIETERRTFMQKKDALNTYQRLNEQREMYDALRREHGRDAKRWAPVTYWLILFAWMVPEFLINWESFLKIPILASTPALVLGSVTLVAAFFAASSHIIGTLLKQRQDKFGGAISATERRKSRWELTLAIILFLLAMGIVVWGRYMLINDIIREKSILRGEGLDTEDVLYTIGALLGNIGVWIAGIWWSYTRHDSVPGFSELRAEVERLQSKMSKLYERFLTSRSQRHILAARSKIEQLQRSEQAQASKLNGYREARELFGLVRQKDEEVAALLAEYKGRLISKMVAENSDAIFIVEDITTADIDIERRLTPDQYANAPLQLRYIG
jgi:hypothetical protein